MKKYLQSTALRCTVFMAATSLGSVPLAHADITDLFGEFANELEESAAQATLLTYTRLVETEGCSDDMFIDPGTDPDRQGEPSACTGQIYLLFSNVREIIHTANEITGDGPTAFSLGTDLEGLGFALR